MFIKVTRIENDKVIYINEDDIRAFYWKDESKYTVLDKKFGTECVKETPEEILQELRGV